MDYGAGSTSNHCSCSLQDCDAYASAQILDQQFVEAEQALASLRQRRDLMRTVLNKRHDPFILRLPVETASRIFFFCHDFIPADRAFPNDEAEGFEPEAALQLGAVCHGWRTIAYSTPSLWNNILIRVTDTNAFFLPELVHDWLNRAASLPLDIRLDVPQETSPDVYPSVSEIIAVLNSHSSHWKALDLCVPYEHLKQLRSNACSPVDFLSISTYDDEDPDDAYIEFDLGCTPKPGSLYFPSADVARIKIDWSNLTTFWTCGTRVQQFFEILNAAPRLQCVDCDCLHEDDSIPPPVPVIHHHLSKMTVTQHPERLWDSLTLPSIAILDCHSMDGTPWRSFRKFLLRSNSQVKELSIGNRATFDISDVIETLSITKELETLQLNIRTDPFDLFHTMSQTRDSNDFLPCLKKLVWLAESEFKWICTSSVIAASAYPALAGRPLQDIAITLFEPNTSDLDRETLAQILAAKAKGLLISIVGMGARDEIWG